MMMGDDTTNPNVTDTSRMIVNAFARMQSNDEPVLRDLRQDRRAQASPTTSQRRSRSQTRCPTPTSNTAKGVDDSPTQLLEVIEERHLTGCHLRMGHYGCNLLAGGLVVSLTRKLRFL